MSFGQGSTTAGINGQVVASTSNETLPGATVMALHTESGFQYATISDELGYFRIPNMNVGGPYKVTVTFVGYNDFELDNIFLSLGQTLKINVNLSESSEELEEIIIAADRFDNDIFDGNRTGAETVVDIKKIESLPTVGRDLTDFTRLTPQAVVRDNEDGALSISIAGANNRYNSLSIDGAVNNDVFGLSATGTNGGQTGASPISMDAIEQFQVVLAPFDIRQSGFAGGGINAVTRRGTNRLKGSVYYFTRNENLAGKTPTDDSDVDREKLDPFTARTYGVRVGGPIIKNKVHFFLNAEQQNDETPQPYTFSETDYRGNATLQQLQDFRDKLINEYDYDPGWFTDNTRKLESNKILARLDFNLSEHHKLMIRHSYTKSIATKPIISSNSTINFINSGEYFPSTTNSTAAELKSMFGQAANNLIVTYTSVRDDRDPTGKDFPKIEIRDGAGYINAGSEEYSTANQLDQDVLTVTNNFTLYKGKHTITFGANMEHSKTYNLFIRRAYGEFRYNSIDDFLNDVPAERFRIGYSMVDNIRGDGSAAAAEFAMIQAGVYAQDEFQLSDDLKITAGVRIDMPIFPDDPTAIQQFDTTFAKIEAQGIETYGAESGKLPDPQLLLSPRVGFNYDIMGDQTLQLRGGLGIFTSRLPLVWPGGAYTNNGLSTSSYSAYGTEVFNPNIDQLPPANQISATPVGGQIDLFAKDFKFPQVFKANLAVDKKLPYGLIGTIEGIFSKTINNVAYYNININPSTNRLTNSGADDRIIYDGYGSKIESFYDHIIVGTNTNEGHSYNLTFQIEKTLQKGFSGSLAYTFGRTKVINEGTSSQNSSQWRYMESVNGRNNLDLTYSDFDLGSRVVGFASYQIEYANHARTTISLYYSGQSGKRYSWVYGGGSLIGDDIWGATSDLIYVPENSSEINLVDIGTVGDEDYVSAAQQWTDLESFINDDEYLKEMKGDYVERNGSRLPFTHNFDLKIAQDIFVEALGSEQTLQITLDIFNIGNFINEDWGRKHYIEDDAYQLITFEGFDADGTTPQFTFVKPSGDHFDIDDSGIFSSRWQAQIGIRYMF